MDNFLDALGQAEAETNLTFTIEPETARRKLVKHLGITSLQLSFLPVRWALGCLPERVDVRRQRHFLRVEFQLSKPPLEEATLRECILYPTKISEGILRDLTYALCTFGKEAEVELKVEGPGASFQYKNGSISSLPSNEGPWLCSFQWRPRTSSVQAALLKRIRNHCQYSSIPVFVDGRCSQSGGRFLLEHGEGYGMVYAGEHMPRVRRSFHLSARPSDCKVVFIKRGVVVETIRDILPNYPCRATAVVDADHLTTDISGFRIVQNEAWRAEVAAVKETLIKLAFQLRDELPEKAPELERAGSKVRTKAVGKFIGHWSVLGFAGICTGELTLAGLAILGLGTLLYDSSEVTRRVWSADRIPGSVRTFCRMAEYHSAIDHRDEFEIY